MGRTKGSVNKSKKDKELKSPPKQEVKIPILEEPLMIFVCRRCNGNFNSNEAYQTHDCPEQTFAVICEDSQPEPVASPKKSKRLSAAKKNKFEEVPEFDLLQEIEATKKIRKPYAKKSKEPENIACETCGKTFTRKYHLERHLIHTPCNPGHIQREEFSCEVCGKVFTRVDNLRMHLRAHLGVKTRTRDFQCPYCEKSFYGSSLLNIHIRTHTKVSSYWRLRFF
jgi:uncharacterized Zn-finger protein